MRSRQHKLGLIALRALAGILLLSNAACRSVPQPTPTYDLRVLDQGWSPADRQTYYHLPQGTQIMEYEWFLALEQAFNTNLFRSNEHVSRYRLLPDPSTSSNPDRLPVGVVKDVNDDSGKAYLGLTCSACHNGQINYKGIGIRIDGGGGMLDISAYIEEMFKALFVTEIQPWKFDRFAHRVLGDKYSDETKSALRAEVKAKLKEVKTVSDTASRLKLYPTPEGFGRQDALGHGGNNGFGNIGIESNYTVADAPVSYPAVWQALNWDWVQYNGSIHQPMGRNVGEVLGVGGYVVLKGKKEDLYKSSVKVMNLYKLETLVERLKAPQWPEDILGTIDREKVSRGAALFKNKCAGCHEGAYDQKQGLYKIKLIPLDHIGTDPKQAQNLANHKIDTGDLGFGVISAGEALGHITENVAQRKYKELGISAEEQAKMNRGRPNLWQAPLSYRAHTLHAIWATPPYLHNGSVPNMYELLSPREERSKKFYTGNLEYDPALLGYEKGSYKGGFQYDTALPGNSNAGHEFRDGPVGNGVLGPKITPQERMDLIEYLKTR